MIDPENGTQVDLRDVMSQYDEMGLRPQGFVFLYSVVDKSEVSDNGTLSNFFRMMSMRYEMEHHKRVFISKKDADLSGSAIASTLEGIRPLMIEVQALVSTAVYGTPQRTTTGYNLKRLHMVLAVLEKRAGFKLAAKDVFLNITGGISIDDPAIDLAVVASILSSNQDIAISPNVCFAAEIGLAGEIRPVSKIDQRISEAKKLGYKTFVASKYNKITIKDKDIKLILVGKIEEVFATLFA